MTTGILNSICIVFLAISVIGLAFLVSNISKYVRIRLDRIEERTYVSLKNISDATRKEIELMTGIKDKLEKLELDYKDSRIPFLQQFAREIDKK